MNSSSIYYLGPEGSYSHLLVQSIFVNGQKIHPVESFQKIIDHVLKEKNAIGVLAIENSISSSVHQTVDLLYGNTVSIVGEASMILSMSLLTAKPTTIDLLTDIYSHPQALAQCSDFIKEHNVEIHEMHSTSEAAHFIKQKKDDTKAAVGSSWLAKKEHLHILKSDISNAAHNMTRWVFVAKPGSLSLEPTIDKLTYIFKVKHEPGSLVAALKEIANHEGNLTKIESRPLPGSHWEYGFWIDVEIPEGTFEIFNAMMKKQTLECRLIGSYKRGKLIAL